MDTVWLTDNAWLTCFSKSGERVVARVKGAEYKYVQGYQYYEEELIMRERDRRGLSSHRSVSIQPTGNIRLLLK